MKKIFVLRNNLLFCCLVLTGCAHPPVQNLVQITSPEVTGAVLDKAVLSMGGNLALMPFRAGPQAEANDELDRLSMAILRGIKDTLDEHHSVLHVITNESQGQPQMVLQGYIQEYSKAGRLSRLMMRPYRNRIIVVGEIWLAVGGQRLLNFSAQRDFNPKKDKPGDVAYAIGQAIGDFITKEPK